MWGRAPSPVRRSNAPYAGAVTEVAELRSAWTGEGTRPHTTLPHTSSAELLIFG